MKNKIDGDFIKDFSNSNLFQNSFIIKLDIKCIADFKKVKTLEDDIRNIDGIYEVNSSGCDEFIEVYEKTGIKGIRAYNNLLTIMYEQGVDEVNSHLEEHKEIRKLLKGIIHF